MLSNASLTKNMQFTLREGIILNMGKKKGNKQYMTRTALLEENRELKQEISELKSKISKLEAIHPDEFPIDEMPGEHYPISGIDETP